MGYSIKLHNNVGIPVAKKPAVKAPRAKKPKYQSSPMTRGERTALLIGVGALVLAAVLIPRREAEPASSGETELLVSTEKVKLPPPPAAPRELLAALQQESATAAGTKTDAEEDYSGLSIDMLADALVTGSGGARAAAYKGLLAKGSELNERLPKLIQERETPAVADFANAARELRIETAVAPILARLQDPERFNYGRAELFLALGTFTAKPEVMAFLRKTIDSGSAEDRAMAWAAMGPALTVEQAGELLERALQPGADGNAAAALGRFGSTRENALAFKPALETALASTSGAPRLALLRALSGMHSEASAPLLSRMVNDIDPQVRGIVLESLGRNAEYTQVALNAVRQDSDMSVKSAALRGLSNQPTPEVLSECIQLLDVPELARLARNTLVKANNGEDLGWRPFVWQTWLDSKNAENTDR